MFEFVAKEQVRGIKGFPLNFVQIWEILSGENDKEILPGEEWEISVLGGYE